MKYSMGILVGTERVYSVVTMMKIHICMGIQQSPFYNYCSQLHVNALHRSENMCLILLQNTKHIY